MKWKRLTCQNPGRRFLPNNNQVAARDVASASLRAVVPGSGTKEAADVRWEDANATKALAADLANSLRRDCQTAATVVCAAQI